jgi:hypothetical protein
MVHSLRLRRTTIGAFFLAAASFHMASAQDASIDPLHIKQTKDLFLRANGLPVEYRAEIQLDAMEDAPQVVTRKSLPDLRDLYGNLGSVQYQFPYEYGIQFTFTQNKEYWIFSGLLGTKVEALSLRLRLLHIISKVDPIWASREYKRLSLSIPRSDCSAVLVPKPDEYIAAAPQFLKLTTANSLNDYEWLQDFIGRLPSPLFLAPTATLLTSTSLRPDYVDALVRQYELILATSTATDREAGVIFQKQQFVDLIKSLSNKLVNTQRDSYGLLLALRAFIVRSHAEPACTDSVVDWGAVRSAFNLLVVDLKQGQRIKSISESEFAPRDTASPASAHSTPMPDQSRVEQLIGEFFSERRLDDKALSSVGASSGNSHLQEVTESIIALSNDINPARYDCPECAAFYKTQILLQASDVAPQSPQKDLLMRLAVVSLAENENQYSSPVLWLPLAELLLNQTRQVSPSAKEQLSVQLKYNDGYIPFGPTSSGPDIRREMEATGNSILNSYLQADGLRHHSFWAPYLDALK